MTPNIPNSRAKLSRVIRNSGDIVRTEDAAKLLDIQHNEASKLLARWAKQGWLKRIGPGVYLPVPVDALGSEHVLAHSWLLVPALFDPAYVTGWSAAEYWDLTEQIFREVVVKTTQTLRYRTKSVHGVSFILRSIKPEHYFGTKDLWRSQTKVAIADIDRCIVDMLDEPFLGGGIQHVADCFASYTKHENKSFQNLIGYADRLGNGAIFKRLGFLAERAGLIEIEAACKKRLTAGHAKLDPKIACPRLVTRWRLRVPTSWAHS